VADSDPVSDYRAYQELTETGTVARTSGCRRTSVHSSCDKRKLVDCGEDIPRLACFVLRLAIGSSTTKGDMAKADEESLDGLHRCVGRGLCVCCSRSCMESLAVAGPYSPKSTFPITALIRPLAGIGNQLPRICFSRAIISSSEYSNRKRACVRAPFAIAMTLSMARTASASSSLITSADPISARS